jgi:hypothetical protein
MFSSNVSNAEVRVEAYGALAAGELSQIAFTNAADNLRGLKARVEVRMVTTPASNTAS